MNGTSKQQGAGFGRGRKLGIAFAVFVNVAFAVVIWALLNFVFTKPTLRTTLDLSPGAKFSLGEETEALIESLRERGDELEIDTFFANWQGSQDPGGIHARVKALAYDLIERIRFLGGQQIKVHHNDVARDIASSRERVRKTGGELDTVTLTIGKKTRRVHLIHDMADIDRPDAGGVPGQQQSQFVLRGFKGEQALASALKSILIEDAKLKAYWVQDYFAGDPSDQQATGYAGLARRLMDDGFENQRISLATAREIPKDCRLLLLLQPTLPISGREAALIQSYVRGGGSVLMTAGIGRGGMPLVHNALLDAFGLQLGTQQLYNGIPDPSAGGSVRYGEPLCSLLAIEDGWNATHPVTRRFVERGMTALLPQARPVRLAETMPAGVRGSYLITSNPFAWTEAYVEGVPPNFRPPSEQALGRVQVAAAVEVDGLAEGDERRQGRFALIGALAFVNGGDRGDRLIDRHGQFVLELCNWLASREARVDVPERYRRTETIELTPQQVERVEYLVAYGVPLAFLAFAFFLVFWRRRA